MKTARQKKFMLVTKGDPTAITKSTVGITLSPFSTYLSANSFYGLSNDPHYLKAIVLPTVILPTRYQMNHVHRAAIALNNIGCSLMEQGCLRQARATFQDSIALLKVTSTGSYESLPQTMDQLIHPAMKRLSSPLRDALKLGFVMVVPDDVCCSAAIHKLSHGGHQFSRMILIRIEDYGQASNNERDLEVDSCIVLQNYVASSLYKKISSGHRRKPHGAISDQSSVATKLLRICLNMLARRYENSLASAQHQSIDLPLCCRVVAIAYVATYSLVQATLASRASPNDTTNFAAQHQSCQRLQQLFQWLQMLDTTSSFSNNAAAA